MEQDIIDLEAALEGSLYKTLVNFKQFKIINSIEIQSYRQLFSIILYELSSSGINLGNFKIPIILKNLHLRRYQSKGPYSNE